MQAAERAGDRAARGRDRRRARRVRHRPRPAPSTTCCGCWTARGIDRQTMDDFVESGPALARGGRRPLPRPRHADRGRPRRRAGPRRARTPIEMMTLAEIALPFAERGEPETQALADRLYRELARRRELRGARARVQPQRDRARTAACWSRCRRRGCPRPSAPRCCCSAPARSPGRCRSPAGWRSSSSSRSPQLPPRSRRTPRDPEAREALRQQLFAERITSFGQGYLQELLGDAAHRRAMTLPVALTLGDPSGIGGEIALKAWTALRGRLAFFLIGDPDHMRRLAARARPAGPRRSPRPARRPRRCRRPAGAAASPAPPGRRPAAPTRPTPPPSSRSSPAASSSSAAARRSRSAPTRSTRQALIDGRRLRLPRPHRVPRAPLRRAAAGDDARRAGAAGGAGHHPPPARRRARRADRRSSSRRRSASPTAALVADFGLAAPRIAVAGLNPHAGEGGAMGREEIEVIAPVLARLRAEGMALTGPHSADTLFHPAARARLRRGGLHVPRPGADPDQDPRLRRRRQRHPRPRLRAHLARPRHRLRHRRPGPRQPREPDRRARARPQPSARPACGPAR